MVASDFIHQASNGANVARLSLNQNFWLAGANGYDPNYANTIKTVVGYAEAAGISVILDLHWSDQGNLASSAGQQVMAGANSITFWQQLAAAYKNDPEVLFELYN